MHDVNTNRLKRITGFMQDVIDGLFNPTLQWPTSVEENWIEKRQAYAREQLRLTREFKQRALEHVLAIPLGGNITPEAEELFSRAWQNGYRQGHLGVLEQLIRLTTTQSIGRA